MPVTTNQAPAARVAVGAPHSPGAAPAGRGLVELARWVWHADDSIGSAANLGGLGLLVWGLTSETRLGAHGTGLLALVLLVTATVAWVAWTVLRLLGHRRAALWAMVTMGCAGAALAPFALLAITFLGVAALGAGTAWPARTAMCVVAAEMAALVIAIPASGRPLVHIGDGLSAALAGFVLGAGRRQAGERGTRAAMAALDKARSEIEHARAEVLAERNRLAREIHDVLAHTLSALSVQLEAVDAVAYSTGAAPALAERLEETRMLVRSGLAEARRAVTALREDSLPLVEELDRLCRVTGAHLAVRGDDRPLTPEASLTLYRVAQEALTNAMKHAPGQATEVAVDFVAGSVALSVTNRLSRSGSGPLAASGGGFGLQGVRERVLLLGGQVTVGLQDDRWALRATVPA